MIAGFTGAGISTESGVPDFRSPGSPWLKNQPIPFDGLRQQPGGAARGLAAQVHDGRSLSRRKAEPRPSRARRPRRAGKMPAVITQNIDGLQQEAGVAADKVIELHGNGTYATCLDCGERHELDWVRRHFEATGDAPDCRRCGGIVKSATISFGQAMPDEPMRRAQELTLACDLFLVIGSSLVVYPAAGFPLLAKQQRRHARHRQPRADGARRVRRSRHQRRDRRRARALHRGTARRERDRKVTRLTQMGDRHLSGFPRFATVLSFALRVAAARFDCGFGICLRITSPVR